MNTDDEIDPPPLSQELPQDPYEAALICYDPAFIERLCNDLADRECPVIDRTYLEEGLRTRARQDLYFESLKPVDLRAFRDRARAAKRATKKLSELLAGFNDDERNQLIGAWMQVRRPKTRDGLADWYGLSGEVADLFSTTQDLRELLTAAADIEIPRGRRTDNAFRAFVAAMADLFEQATGRAPTRTHDPYAQDDPSREPENSPFYAFLRQVKSRHPYFKGRSIETAARTVLEDRRKRAPMDK